jgi:hypothetical protein
MWLAFRFFSRFGWWLRDWLREGCLAGPWPAGCAWLLATEVVATSQLALAYCPFHTATAIHFPKFQSATSQPSQNEPMPRLNLSYVFRIPVPIGQRPECTAQEQYSNGAPKIMLIANSSPRARGFVTRSRSGARGRDAKQCGTLALATERPQFTLFPRPRIER